MNSGLMRRIRALVTVAAITGTSLGAGWASADLLQPGAESAPATPQSDRPDSLTGLSATTDPPWVPDRPVRAAEPWETAVRLPGRIVTLPLSALGYLTQHTLITVEDAHVIPKVSYFLAILPNAGLIIGPASLGDGTGFGVSAGVAPPGIRRFLTASWEGSTLNYSRTRVTARAGPARLLYSYEWRPQDRFYGLGPSSSRDDTSNYGVQSQQVRLGLAYRIGADGPWRLDLASWAGPRELITRRGRDEDIPSFDQQFPGLGGILDRRFEHLAYGARLGFDTRSGVPRWSRGGRVMVEAERFSKPVGFLALRTTEVPYQFTRWVGEVEGGLSFHRDPRTFRLLVRVVDNVPDASGTMLPSDFASLGGSRGLHGFDLGRFHDVDAVLGRLTYLFPLAIRFELDVHAEVGAVHGDVWRDARAASLATSYGVYLRPRLDNAVLGSVGVDWSVEAVRFRFSIGGVE
jgi:hypothetical protein